MKLEIVNHTDENFSTLEKLLGDFYQFMLKKNQQILNPVKVYLISDLENSKNPLGKTAYYDPENFEIVLYVDGRHVKDLMRSFSHELRHHIQNCRGDFQKNLKTFEGYAQEDPHLRKMEKEAYLWGNMNFRDWEDHYKKSENSLLEWVKSKRKLLKD